MLVELYSDMRGERVKLTVKTKVGRNSQMQLNDCILFYNFLQTII